MTDPYLRKMYVAASFSQADRVRKFRDDMADVIEITSSWCEEPPLVADDYREHPIEARYRANEDFLDIARSSIVAVLTDVPSTTGGLHVELGLALADPNKRVIVVGGPKNVFHYMNRVEHKENLEALAAMLEYEYNEGYATV